MVPVLFEPSRGAVWSLLLRRRRGRCGIDIDPDHVGQRGLEGGMHRQQYGRQVLLLATGRNARPS